MRILRCNRTGAFTCLASCWHDHINVAVQNQAPRSLFGACWGDVGECAFGSGRIFVMNTRSFSIEECPLNTSNLTEVLAVEFGGVLAWGHPGYLAETTARCKSSSDRGSARAETGLQHHSGAVQGIRPLTSDLFLPVCFALSSIAFCILLAPGFTRPKQLPARWCSATNDDNHLFSS